MSTKKSIQKSKSSTKKSTNIKAQDDEKYNSIGNNMQFKPHSRDTPNLQKKFIEFTTGDITDIYKDNTSESDVFNEVANISAQTMKKYNLRPSQIYIENANNCQYNDVLSLIQCDTDRSNRIFLNKTSMENLHLKENDKIKLHIIPDNINQNDTFREAIEIQILPFDDRKIPLAANRLFNSYLKPYFQPKKGENRNYIVKRHNILYINNKKFRVMNFKLKINPEIESESEFDFCMVTNSTTIECDGDPVKNSNGKEANTSQLVVADLTMTKRINKAEMHKYNTMVLLSKHQMNRLSYNNGDIVVIKGKKGKIRYCRVMMYDSKVVTDNNCIYMSDIMKSNLRVETNDCVTISRNRVCKRMKFASRIFVTAVLGDDADHNDDYNDGNKLLKEYLEPYLKPSKNKEEKSQDEIYNVVTGEDYVFEINGIEFIVLEIEANDDDECQYAIVNEKTFIEIDVDGVEQDEIYNHYNDIGYNDIGDCHKQIDEIKYIINTSLLNPTVLMNFGLFPEIGVLLYGPPGTGKTSLAKAIESETNLTMCRINGPDIISSEMGVSESKLKRAFKYVADNAPGIVFIDEIESILVYKNIKSALTLLMESFKTKSLLVIGATNKINKIDVTLRRSGLFGKEIRFNVPNEKGREDILKILTRKMKSNMDDTIKLTDIAKKTHGFVGADLNQLCQTAAEKAIKECSDNNKNMQVNINVVIQKTKLTAKHFEYALSVTNPSSVKDVVAEKPNVTWEDIGGLKDIKQQMIEMIENPLKHGDIYELYGNTGSRGCLLWGPPGNGKTYLAKAIANKCNTNFIYVKGPELLSKFMGESEQNVRELFEKARNAAPTIIFFDEIDALAPVRGGGNSTTDRVVNQLLTEMDGMNGAKDKPLYYLGATNRPDLIDPALKRPGRLEQMIFIDLPDEEARYEILKAALKKCPKDLREPKEDREQKVYEKKSMKNPYKLLAQQTAHFTGADLKGVVDRAKNMAVNHHINNRHLFNIKNGEQKNITFQMMEDAIKNSRPSITKSEYQKYLNMKSKHERSTGDNEMNDSKEELDIDGRNTKDIKDFVFDVFGNKIDLANKVYKYLIGDEAGYDDLELLLQTCDNGINELCEDLELKHGWKIKFVAAIHRKQK